MLGLINPVYTGFLYFWHIQFRPPHFKGSTATSARGSRSGQHTFRCSDSSPAKGSVVAWSHTAGPAAQSIGLTELVMVSVNYSQPLQLLMSTLPPSEGSGTNASPFFICGFRVEQLAQIFIFLEQLVFQVIWCYHYWPLL